MAAWQQPLATLEVTRRVASLFQTAKHELAEQAESAALEYAAATQAGDADSR
jgi:hypothetical protein